MDKDWYVCAIAAIVSLAIVGFFVFMCVIVADTTKKDLARQEVLKTCITHSDGSEKAVRVCKEISK